MLTTITGDGVATLGSTAGSGWAGVANQVSDWSWNYRPSGSNKVGFSLTSRQFPADYTQVILNEPLPYPAILGVGYFGSTSVGTGTPNVIGTVTITADTTGSFQGGGIYNPVFDGFFGAGSLDGEGMTATLATYVVAPEPSAALLVGLGLAVIAGSRRAAK